MGDKLEKLVIKFCEWMPLNLTLYEKNMKCTKPNKICDYCEKMKSGEYYCNKQTYMFNDEIVMI